MVPTSGKAGCMTHRMMATSLALLVLAGCTPAGSPEPSDERPATEVSDSLRAIAAPHQDLSTVRVLEEDGCYWYRHVGPVETTLLPLRTVEGRPICARPQGGDAAAPQAEVSRATLSFAR